MRGRYSDYRDVSSVTLLMKLLRFDTVKKRLLLLAALLTFVVGCSTEVPQLRVGTNVWYGYEPAYLAAAKGFFDDKKIRIVRFSSASEVMRAYRNGLIDVAAVTLDEALRVSTTHGKQKVVVLCDWSYGADAILARPEYLTLESLKGRRIGLEESALGAYLLSRALECAGLSNADVTTVNVPLLEHRMAYEKGLIDAVVTFEPHRTELLSIGARSVFDSRQIPREIGDVLMTREMLSTSKEQLLRDFVSGWFQALDLMKEGAEETEQIIARNQGISVDELHLIRDGVHLVRLDENAELLGEGGVELIEAFTRVQERMQEHGVIDGQPLLPAFDSSYLPAMDP